ncbi:MAG: pitrilysin family protein [bacterium]|nr:pitrilysin family protein [bacterium]
MHDRRHPLIGAFAVLLLAGACAAPPAARHPLDLALPPLRLEPPRVERLLLDCGAPLYILEDRSLPLFGFFGLARAGSAWDPQGKEGLAALVAETIRTGGAGRLGPEELDRELEFIAAAVSTTADQDAVSISLSCLSRDAERALPLVCDMLARPAFDPGRVELRKEQVREIIRRRNDEPRQIVGREFRRLVYGGDPYAHPVVGEPGAMDRIGRGDIEAFHGDRLAPAGMIFGAAGDFDRATVVRILNGAFGPAPRAGEGLPPPPAAGTRRVTLIERETEQAHIIVGHLGIRRDDPDYFRVMIMNEILGGGSFSSRILERVRVREGLAYHAATAFTTNLRDGLFYAVCQTKQETAAQALRIILEEIERIRSEPVTPDELAAAKESFSNSFVFRFATPLSSVEQAASLEFYGLPADYLETYLDRVAGVTAGDVLAAARARLHPDRAAILVLGDRSRISPPLEEFGPVRPLFVPGPSAPEEADR